MFGTKVVGAFCVWPRAAYQAAELPAEFHAEVLKRFTSAAYRDLKAEAETPDKARERIRTPKQRAGLRERAEEAGAEAYAHWLAIDGAEWCGRGDHGRAIGGVIRFFRLSGWKGRTGLRRASRRAEVSAMLEMRDRLKGRNVPTPCDLAQWAERLKVAKHARKAERVAERLGLSVDGLARLANGLAIESGEHRPRRVHPAPIPAPLPDPFPAERSGPTTVDARHGWVVRPDPSGTLPEVRYAGTTTRESDG